MAQSHITIEPTSPELGDAASWFGRARARLLGGPASRQETDWIVTGTSIGVLALLGIFVVYPLFLVFKASFVTSDGWTLALFTKLIADRGVWTPLKNSLWLATCVGLSSALLGYALAVVMTLTTLPYKKVIRGVVTVPMVAPPFILALAAIMLLGQNGVLTKQVLIPLLGKGAVPSIYGFWGLFVVETLSYFPMAYLMLVGVLSSIDPVLEEAALNQGASRSRVFWDVIFPLSTPGLLSAFLIGFIESLADFGNPLILSGDFKVLAVEAYLKITGEYDTAGGAGLALILLVPSLIAFFVQKYWAAKKSFVTMTGKPSSSKRARTSGWAFALSAGFCMVLVGTVSLFYGAVVYGSFVETWGANSQLTLRHYTQAFTDAWPALRDSLVLSALSTPVSAGLGMVIAYLVVRKSFWGKSLMDMSSMLTFAVPGTVVGIGYILAFNQAPLQLTGTAAIIVLLLGFRNAPVGIQSASTALRQIDKAIEEASSSLGGSSFFTFRKIVLPLLAPSFFSGMAYSFVKSLTAVSAVIFVVSGSWHLVTISILGFVENSFLSRASALSLILCVIVSAVLGVMNRWVARMGVQR